MYICEDCKAMFNTPEMAANVLTHGDNGIDDIGYTYICPKCRSEFISEAARCPVCGDYKEAMELCGCCEACESKLRRRFKKLLEDNFTAKEIEILNESFDGEALM
ncbi:MAG: hypothetical protein KH354_09025 [Clostridiales bacterium]|nr:hypothetical protein [Clostridiales bacterium]